jgi:RimJ/RimL family protein N-acetyltransferase
MEFAGYLGVEYDTRQNAAEVQIAVLPKFQKMGLAKEALITCNDYCRKIDVNKVYAKFRSENQPAKNLAISAGMKFKKYIYKKGKTIELYTF